MKTFKFPYLRMAFGALLAIYLVYGPSRAQVAPPPPAPVIGQAMSYKDDSGRVTAFQLAPQPQGGGIIQLSAFGWLEPYVDSVAQALLGLGLAWLGRSKYTQWMDQSSRDALEAFTKNAASSLIADGFVHMQGKAVVVHDAALANEVNTAADRIPGAMKRFGLTPAAVAQKVVDAIPQTAAGAQIVADAHRVVPVEVTAPPPPTDWPPTSGASQ